MFVFIIKKIRTQKGISIYELSKITNLSRTYIRDLENNRRLNVSLSVLYKLANALEVNIKDLFYTKFDIEELKQQMYKKIEIYGINSKEALETSNLIDLLINIDMNEKNKEK